MIDWNNPSERARLREKAEKMNRDEQLNWCKKRALQYVDRGEVVNALISFTSDIDKDPSTAADAKVANAMWSIAISYCIRGDVDAMRRWIEGFR